MNRPGFCFLILLLLIFGSRPCHAAKLKAYVHKFTVPIAENRDELKTGLQTLLMSRLNSDEIQAVDNQSEADIQISGSYIVFGNIFSLDALIKTNTGTFIDRVFVQGDTQNELIPTVAQMAYQLQRALMKWNPALTAKALVVPAPYPAAKAPVAVAQKPVPVESRPATVPKAPAPEKPAAKPWVSQRLPEILNSIAKGTASAAGETEIFITGDHNLGYYRKGETLQFVSETVFEADEIVYGVDVADLDHNGVTEIYVSIVRGGLPASRVFIPENNALKQISGTIPYLLRGIALEGKTHRIFAQKITAAGSFSGDIYELAKTGDNFNVTNPMQLPLFGNLYNFNRFTAKGKRFFIVAHPDGYLLVYSKDKKQLWKSREKFGGKETFECTVASTDANAPLHAATACSLTPAQRLLVTRTGDIFVSRNTGLTATGAMRSYSRNNVVQLAWDGTALQEEWRSEQSQNYLADFSYDERNRELLLLEVEPKSGALKERSSRLVIRTLP